MGDGVVSVDTQRHQDVCAAVGDCSLQEFDQLAGGISGTPLNRDAPHNIREYI